MLATTRNQDLIPSILNEMMNFNNWVNPIVARETAMPKMNVSETDQQYDLELCVPGLKKEDLQLSVDHENNLVVEMKKTESVSENQEDRKYLRREFRSMQFRQTIALPENVKKEQISAKVENGILTIVLPKFTTEEKQQLVQTIEIR